MALAFSCNNTHCTKETLIYSAWRRCFSFFATVEEGRVHFCFKKSSRLAKRNNCAFPKYDLTSASLKLIDAQQAGVHLHAAKACAKTDEKAGDRP